ncbi:MAG: gliding motility-associated C-terminal domain-containing protein [Bacteroidales bacterium]|jgi:gliding motility-associated-like protein|nr:gliding motility-associated C-terminal domain-containing protein [Bacteroidales bacterium]
MNNDFDKIIRELLQSYGESPTVDCWNKIESQLETLQTPNPNSSSSSSSAPSGGGSSLSHFAGTVTGKTILTAFTAAAVGGIISLAVVYSTKTETAEQTQPTTTIQQELPNSIPLNENDIRIINQTEVSHSEPENENAVNDPHAHEHADTAIRQENENVLYTHISVIPTANAVDRTSTENSVKQETTPKIEPTPSPTIKESPKEQLSDIKHTYPQTDSEQENVQDIDLSKQPKIKIPNIFTPNGDSFNDYFVIEGIEPFSETHLVVFRRDGSIVYERMNYQNDWNADNIPDGVYYYVFNFTYEGSQFMRNGSITVKRF